MSRRDGATVVPPARPRDYHGRPVIATPVWTWEVPAYFFAGGTAGAAAAIGLAARLAGDDALARRAAVLAFAGAAVSPPLLISDLGRPERFWRMLRVLKPTSPMSLGTWVLSVFAPASVVAAGSQLAGRPGRRAGATGSVVAGALGPVLSTYTAVLLSTTAVPVWSGARRSLPFIFAGSSVAAAGGALAAGGGPGAAAPVRALAAAGAALEIAADTAMRAGLDGRVRASYEAPGVRMPHTAARVLTAGGALALATLGGRSRVARIASGTALCAGSALTRWAIFRAGQVSAADPAQTVGPQRARAV